MAPTASATQYLYAFGGAGDLPGGKNIFVDDFVDLHRFAQKNNWQMEALFDGDQPKAKEKVAQALGGKNLSDFSSTSYNESLDEISMHKSKYKAGDKVIFVISTHGNKESTEYGHGVACRGNISCDIGKLKKTIQELQAQGVQVALLDLSCYSGHSLKMADDKTCVVTASSSSDIGYNQTVSRFIAGMKTGKSLEEIFLESRQQQYGLPQISSPAGRQTEEMIQHLAPESQAVAISFPDRCQLQEQSHLSEEARKILIQSLPSPETAKEYIEASTKYQKIYLDLVGQAKHLASYSNRIVTVNSKKTDWYSLAGMNEKKADPDFLAKKKELEKASSEFRQLESDLKSFQTASLLNEQVINLQKEEGSPLADAAFETQKYESKLYQEIYRSLSKSQPRKANPCADFTL
jgi:hypothetical protein